jgi:hypothetical protein
LLKVTGNKHTYCNGKNGIHRFVLFSKGIQRKIFGFNEFQDMYFLKVGVVYCARFISFFTILNP